MLKVATKGTSTLEVVEIHHTVPFTTKDLRIGELLLKQD